MRLSKSRKQPAPAKVVVEALLEPGRPGPRQWFQPRVGEAVPSAQRHDGAVIWTGLWPDHPGVKVAFAAEDTENGAVLTWTILQDDAEDENTIKDLASRIDYLVNDRLRRSFGQ